CGRDVGIARDDRRIRRDLGLWNERADFGHYINSISAWSAPAALIACRMLIMSRGPTPREFRLLTSSCRLTPERITAMRRSLCSSTWILVRGTTTVAAPPVGANCVPPACGTAGNPALGLGARPGPFGMRPGV